MNSGLSHGMIGGLKSETSNVPLINMKLSFPVVRNKSAARTGFSNEPVIVLISGQIMSRGIFAEQTGGSRSAERNWIHGS